MSNSQIKKSKSLQWGYVAAMSLIGTQRMQSKHTHRIVQQNDNYKVSVQEQQTKEAKASAKRRITDDSTANKSKLAMEELWLCERAMASERTHTFAHSMSESTTDAYCRGIFFWPWQI